MVRILSSFIETVHAQVYNGPGLGAGLGALAGIVGVPQGDLRSEAVQIITTVLSFMALIAVAMVIIAGIYLIVGMGSDESREKAKKIILYTLIGLLIILFARVIVGFVINILDMNGGGGGGTAGGMGGDIAGSGTNGGIVGGGGGNMGGIGTVTPF